MKDSSNRDKVTISKRKFILSLVVAVSLSVILVVSSQLISSSLLPLSPIKIKQVRAQQQPSSQPQQPSSQPQRPTTQSQSSSSPPGNSGNNPLGGPPGQTGINPGQSGNTPGQSSSPPPGKSGNTPGQQITHEQDMLLLTLIDTYRTILQEKQYCPNTVTSMVNEQLVPASGPVEQKIKNLQTAIQNADSLPPGDCRCDPNEDLAGDQCVPKCTGGQVRDPTSHLCRCIEGEEYVNGQCVPQCSPGLTRCGSVCSNLNIDDQNCGACTTATENHACASGQTCQSGSCQQLQCSTDQSNTCGDGAFHPWLYNGGNSFTSPYVPQCTGGQTVTSLYATAEGDYSVLWTQLSGPPVQLSDPTSLNPTFTAPEVQQNTRLTFMLTATVGGSLTGLITYYVDVLPKC